MGITIDPKVAFPGQRVMEVVRPLLSLLDQECSALENFESLMALCNLAGIGDDVRRRILKEGGFQLVEHYMFEDHDLLRRAAMQCVNNLVMCDDATKLFEGENDRVKFLVILSIDDDLELCKAASGALAMLTSVSAKVCEKVFEAKDWLESLHHLLANPDEELQHRGVVLISNMVKSTKEVAEKLIDTDVMEILMALTKSEIVTNPRIKEVASGALDAAAKWKLIEKTGSSGSEVE